MQMFKYFKLSYSRNNRSFLKVFLISFLIVLFIPLAAGLINYNQINVILKDVSGQLHKSLLNQIVIFHEATIEDTEQKLLHFAETPGIRRYANERIDNIRDYILGICRLYFGSGANFGFGLESFMGPTTINFMVWYKESDLIFCRESNYFLHDYYGTLIKVEDLSYEEFKRQYLEPNHRKKFFAEVDCVIEGRQFKAVPYVESMPAGNPEIKDGTIIYFLSTNVLKKALSNTNFSDSSFYILDNGVPIVSVESDAGSPIPLSYVARYKQQKGPIIFGKSILTVTSSEYTGWDYAVFTPIATLMRHIGRVQRTVWIVFFVFLLGGICAVMIFSYRFSKPLRKAYSSVLELTGADDKEGAGIFLSLEAHIDSLIIANKDLKSAVEEQQSIAKEAFFFRLSHDWLMHREEMTGFLEQSWLEFRGQAYGVVLVKIVVDESRAAEKAEYFELLQLLVKSALGKHLCFPGYIGTVNQNTFGVYMCFPEDAVETCRDKAQTYIASQKQEMKKLNVDSVFGMGGIYHDIYDVSKSFREAQEVLAYNEVKARHSITRYEEIPPGKERFYYPIALESSLINTTCSGDWVKTEEIINKLFRENFIKRVLSHYDALLFLHELVGTLNRILNRIDMEADIGIEEFPYVGEVQNVEEVFLTIKDAFKRICKNIGEERQRENIDIIVQAEEVVRANYRRLDFSLTMLEEMLGVSYPYLSRCYHRLRKRTLFEYLTEIRIQHAVRIFEANRELNISEIGRVVGYASDRSFRRAFKKIAGISPNFYQVKNARKETKKRAEKTVNKI